MRLNRAQRATLALGMLGLVAMLLWVPYSATYRGSGASLSTDAGYQWVFTPPNAALCRTAIEDYADAYFGDNYQEARCEIRLDLRRLSLTVAAVILGVGAVITILSMFARGDRSQSTPQREATLAQLSATKAVTSDWVRALLERDPSLPISSGCLTKENPLIITARTDYIPVEYRVMEAFHAGWKDIEYELKNQGLSKINGRSFDELTYKYRKVGQEEWGYEKTYYFDITIGLAELRRQIERRWWQFWK